MSGGSVLLHDGGYRDYMPSGPFGAYRQDYFHNRLVVRPEKIFMGQSSGDAALQHEGGRAGAARARVPAQRRLLPAHPHAQGRLPVAAGVRLQPHPAHRRRVGLRLRPRRRVREGPGAVRRLRHLQVADRRVLHAGEPLAHAEDLRPGRALVRHRVRRHRPAGAAGHEAPARALPGHPLPARGRGAAEAELPGRADDPPDDGAPLRAGPHRGVRHRARAAREGRRPGGAGRRACASSRRRPSARGWRSRSRPASRRITVAAKQDLRMDIARDYRRPRYTFEKGRIAYGPLGTDGDFVFTSQEGDDARLHDRQHDARAVRRPGAVPVGPVVSRPAVRRHVRPGRHRQGPVLARHA